MQLEEFLTFPEEDNIYETLEDDQIIKELVNIFKKSDENSNKNLDDDSTEVELISVSTAIISLENIHAYLLQQENTAEQLKLVNKLEKFVKEKKNGSMKQSTLDQFLNIK